MNELRPLGWARVAIGAIFLLRTTPLFVLVPGLFRHHGGPTWGWPSGSFRAAVLGAVLPDLVVKLLIVLRTIGGIFFMLGVRARVAGIVAVACGYLVYAQQPFALIFTLHALFLAVLVLACTDATAVVALRPNAVQSPKSSVYLVRAFVISLYAWSAIAKVTPEFMDGTILRVLHEERVLDGPIARVMLATPARAKAAAWATFAIEALLPPLLANARTRAAALLFACGFHAVLESVAHPDVFGWLMVVLVVGAFRARVATT